MALKDRVKSRMADNLVVTRLDNYLLKLNSKDEDRRWDINSPSSAGRCQRQIVYSRLGYEQDAVAVDARLRRIFDNGTSTHERLQRYMLDAGILLMDEVPVFYDKLQIQGHCDGLLDIGKGEGAILEIKTINSHSFGGLIDAKEEHKLQAQNYLYCLEERRKFLKENFRSIKRLNNYLRSKEYKQFIRDHYKHLKGGSHYSLDEKFKFKLNCHRQADRLLFGLEKPLDKMVFLYENKDTQEFKEYVVKYSPRTMKDLKKYYTQINRYVRMKKVPKRPKEATSKMCQHCKWCNYTLECWL